MRRFLIVLPLCLAACAAPQAPPAKDALGFGEAQVGARVLPPSTRDAEAFIGIGVLR